jgi:ABC-2 type transport system ATP-binding protein
MEIIRISNVLKTYGENFTLKDINLSIEKGKIFSLIGPNGAGKTTLVKLILDLMHCDQGNITINGIESTHKDSRLGVAFIPEKFTFFPYYTARGVLDFFGTMKGVTGDELKRQIDHALDELNIRDLENQKISKMSKGQVQRVGLASLLIGKNDLIILDEPFSGLDPIGMKDLKDIIRKLKSEGKTFFINSHVLLEMEHLCDELAVLNKGKLLFSGTVDSIVSTGSSLEDFFYKIINADGDR